MKITKKCKMKSDFRYLLSCNHNKHYLQYDPKELVFLFLSVLDLSITCRCYKILSNLQGMSHYYVCSKLSETRSNSLRLHDSFSNHKTRLWSHNYNFVCQSQDLSTRLNSGNSATCQNYHGDVYASVYF